MKTIKPNTEKHEKVMSFCDEWMKRIRAQMEDLTNTRIDAMKCYDGEEYIKKVKGRSQMYTTDLADTIEWVMPKLIQIFAGGDEVTKLAPATRNDVEAAENQNEIINHQLKRKNKWFVLCNDWFRDALGQKIGVVKYQWKNEEKFVDKTYEGMSDMEIEAKLQEPGTKLLERELSVDSIVQEVSDSVATDEGVEPPPPAPPTYDVRIRYTIKDEFPEVLPVPPNDFGMPIDTTDIETCPFCYHMVRMHKWEVEKLWGKAFAEDLETMVERWDDNTDAYLSEKFKDLGGRDFLYDEKEDMYIAYECYFNDPETGVQMRAVIAGDQFAEYDINDYGKPPFRIITPIKMSHRLIGRDYYDMLKQIQKIRTVLLRQLLDNVYFSNNGRYIVDPTKVNINDFMNGNIPGGIIRGKADGVQPLAHTPLDSWVFNLMESIYSERENRTGVTRYSQGTEATSLNKTFRGLVALQQAADIRVEFIARCFAEMGVAPLVKDLVDLNIRYLTAPVAVRIAEDWKEIHPDNIIGNFDIIVNVGIGTGNKEIIVQQMQQLLGLQMQLQQVGIATPANMHTSMKELVRAMGYRNVEEYTTDPQITQAVVMLLQTLMQMGAMQNPQLMQMVQMVAQGMGIPMQALLPQPQPGAPGQGTPEGGVTPEQPMQPAQPRQQPPEAFQVGGNTWG